MNLQKSNLNYIIYMGLCGVLWLFVIKPMIGEAAFVKHIGWLRKGNFEQSEKSILKAIKYDPGNSQYHVQATQMYIKAGDLRRASEHIDQAIFYHNGDMTMWSVWYLRGNIKSQLRDIEGSKVSYEKSIYYNPEFGPAKKNLESILTFLENAEKMGKEKQ